MLVAIVVIPIQLGGFGEIFSAADEKFSGSDAPSDGVLLGNAATLGYSTLAFGSALALFLYPHTLTGVLAARDRNTIKRNMVALPAYTLVLGLLALLGYMAIAAGVQPIGDDVNTIVPVLFDTQFPAWFAGVAFGAITIGALVPAAIMAIAAANLFARNVFKEYLKRDATPEQEARAARYASVAVKGGALLAVLALAPQFSIDLQLIGGVLILRPCPPSCWACGARSPTAGPCSRAGPRGWPRCGCSTTRRTRRPARSTSAARSTRPEDYEADVAPPGGPEPAAREGAPHPEPVATH